MAADGRIVGVQNRHCLRIAEYLACHAMAPVSQLFRRKAAVVRSQAMVRSFGLRHDKAFAVDGETRHPITRYLQATVSLGICISSQTMLAQMRCSPAVLGQISYGLSTSETLICYLPGAGDQGDASHAAL